MADLGNLKILLDMATTGNLKKILDDTDKKLEDLRKKAANLQLGFDDKSFSSLVTKLNDVSVSMQGISKSVGSKLAEGIKQTAEASKGATVEMKQQVSLSTDLEALFKEMAGTLRSIADAQGNITKAKQASKQATKEETAEEQKRYDITRLRQMAEEKNGQLEKDEVAVLKQMEAIEKALIAIDEKHSTHLADQLKKWMHYDGVTKEQLGTYQALITRMQAAMQIEQKAARQQEQADRKQTKAARERAAATKRQAQLETSIIRVETQLLNLNEARLSTEAQILVAKMRNGQITQEEVGRLSALLTKHRAIVSAENQKVDAVQKTNMHLGRQSGLLQQINSYLATYVSVIGAVNLIKNFVRITGEFEAQHVALRAILQDVAGADRIFYQLQELAVKSPFTFRNLTDYAKQLSAFSVPMNEIYDTTKRLADVSAGLGVDMSRIILAYGQIRSASFLRGQEVRQLTEAGIPVLQELSKQFKEIEGEAVSVGKVFDKISARQVPFEMIEKMFKDLTSEGGKFYQMQETLAETVKGKVSNLQDAWEIMLSKVGESNDGFIKGVLDGVTNLIKNYKELAKALELAAIAYGSYRAAVVAATQAEAMQRLVHIAHGKNIAKIPALLTRVTVGLRGMSKAIAGIVTKLNPWAIGIALVTTAVAAIIMHQRELNKHIRETDKLTKDAIAKAEASKSNIHYYIEQMKRAKEGTEEYNKARQAVIDNSGAYISATDAERLSLQNVDDVWVNICKHIEEATKLQAMQSVTAEAAARRQEAQLKIMDSLAKYQQSSGISNEVRQNIAARIRGEITQEELGRRIAGKVPEASGGFYRAGSRNEILLKSEQWATAFAREETKYEEAINHGKQTLSDLTGEFEKNEDKMEEVLDGWRKRVSDYLTTVTGGTRGVKVSGETNLADFAESGAKALNELRAALDLTPKTEKDYAKVEADIKFWEKLSEAIYGKGNTEFNNSTKLTKKQIKDAEELRREQIQAIKQSVQDLKEAKKWYDQLTPLLGSKNAETLLASFNFAVPKEGFGAAFQGYANQLKALGDENGARDVMNWANGREIGDVVESAKAIERYTKSLQDLEAQTKRLNLTGFAQELDKIIVDTDSKNRQLATDWAQKAEELEKAKGGWIQQYRVENEKATEEEALKAWEDFYKKQTDMAKKSIDAQAEYNRKVAQEQINDKASAWLEEMMKENNINLNDMGDKSLEQVNTLISRLEQLASEETLAGLIPAELKEDAALINVEFSKLLSTIKKMANTKLGDLSVEKMKKTLNGVKAIASTLGLNTDTSAVESSFSTLAQALSEVANAQEDVNTAMDNMDAAQEAGSTIDLSQAMDQLSSAQAILAQKTQDAAEAQAQYNAAVAVAGVGALASAVGKVASKMKDLADAAGNKELSEFSDIVNGISQNLNAAAAGYAAAASAGAGAYAWIGAIIGGVSDLLSQAVNAVKEGLQYNRLMENQASAWALAIRQIRNEYALLQQQLDSIFGSATMAKMAGWAENAREQAGLIRDFNNGKAGALANQKIKIADYGVAKAYAPLQHVAPELFDEEGGLNFDYLAEFKNTEFFNQLPDEWKNMLNEIEEANKQFEESSKEMKDYLTSIFGEVGSSIADSMISAFEETGQVAFEVGDILSDVAKKFVKDWTQSFLITNYLKGLGDSITAVWDDESLNMEEQVSSSLGLMRDALTAMGDRIPEIQRFYEELNDQYHWADGAGEEIGDAVKTAMVEQNSSLIAGYINSVRADLTMQKNEIMNTISPAVTTISNGLTEHFKTVASIEGNVSKIWSKLDLLTSSGSGVKLNARI